VTSEEIKDYIALKYQIPKQDIVVSNLRINLNSTELSDFPQRRPRTISFVGRLEKDRGTTIFVDYIKKLSYLDLVINIVGSGRDQKELVESLKLLIGGEKVNVWGELQPWEMAKLWNQTGILISTAASESFGRTIREAACFGVPVLGVASRGFNEFISFSGVPWIRVLDQTSPPQQAMAMVEELLEAKTSLDLRKRIINQQEKQLDALIACWATLLDNDR